MVDIRLGAVAEAEADPARGRGARPAQVVFENQTASPALPCPAQLRPSSDPQYPTHNSPNPVLTGHFAQVQPYFTPNPPNSPAMLAYRSTLADHFAPQPSTSRASAPAPAPAQFPHPPPPRATYTSSARPSAYDSQPITPSAYPAAPAPTARQHAAPPAPPAAAPPGGAAGPATGGKMDKGKLTEQWGPPPDLVKRDKEFLERGKLLGEVSTEGWRGGIDRR